MIVWNGRRPGSTRPETAKQAPRFCRTMPVPGATTPGTEAVEDALDERDRHAVGVDGAEVHRSARELARRAGRVVPSPVEVGRLEEVGHVGAVADVGERVLQREPRARDAVRQRRLEPSEQAERLERRDALPRRGKLEHLDASVVEAQRLDPPRLEAGQVGLVEPG